MQEETKTMTSLDRSSARCTACGSPMAGDQRYCLECGKRKGEPRTDFASYLNGADQSSRATEPSPNVNGSEEVPATKPEVDTRPEREVTPLMAAAGLAGLAVILLLGVLIGRLGDTGSSAPVVATTGVPTVTSPTTETSVEVAFAPDWPEGQEGFTIELATLEKSTADGAAVEATKTDLIAQGAPEVGALDSDQFGSLPAGNYVFYSGVYDTKADAEAALKPLQASFPDAQVIEVAADSGGGGGGGGGGGSAGAVKTTDAPLVSEDGSNKDPNAIVKADQEALEDINSADAEDYQELQKKLPENIATEGKLPPKDNKKPGAGGPGAVEIG